MTLAEAHEELMRTGYGVGEFSGMERHEARAKALLLHVACLGFSAPDMAAEIGEPHGDCVHARILYEGDPRNGYTVWCRDCGAFRWRAASLPPPLTTEAVRP